MVKTPKINNVNVVQECSTSLCNCVRCAAELRPDSTNCKPEKAT